MSLKLPLPANLMKFYGRKLQPQQKIKEASRNAKNYGKHNDNQHNDTQHNDTWHQGLICETKHK
jgi:hypothetical protein